MGKSAITLLLCLLSAGIGHSAETGSLTGGLDGLVTDVFGVPQMGATIQVLDGADRVVKQLLSDKLGRFEIDALAADNYTVRVKMAGFLPALRRVGILPGTRPLLNISLASIFSSIELIYLSPEQRRFMSDDWKWVLRSTSISRPALRFMPSTGRDSVHTRTLFADTQGVVQVSAGDQGKLTPLGSQADLGTAFAIATSLYGDANLRVSGNLGYGMSGTPTTGFETRYTPGLNPGMNPEVRLSLKQAFLPGALGLPNAAAASQPGTLSSMSASVSDRIPLGERLELQYGGAFDSVTFFDRLNYVSPYAKILYRLPDESLLQLSYSSGLPPVEMLTPPNATDEEMTPGETPGMTQDLQTLALFPRVSVRDGRVQVQRITNYEIGYETHLGSTRLGAAAYHSQTLNAGLTLLAHDGLPNGANLLPDLLSDSFVVNAGTFQSTGGMVSATRRISENLELSAGYGTFTALAALSREAVASGQEIRDALGSRQLHFAKVSGNLRFRGTGTRAYAGYQWNSTASAMAGHLFVTQRYLPQEGLSILIRQPIGTVPGLRGRLEATMDLSNLLAEGYVPMVTPDGRTVVLVHTPRSLRGGLSFVF
ncbi:MAG: TonB-dependent receptor [Bryobacterales bacterium]|nr:TonB-dependent receptor [Bryobacterales bacterium]